MVVKTKDTVSEKQAAGYFWRIFEMNAVPVVIWGHDGHIYHANNAFLDMLGYSRKEFEQGKINWHALTPPGFERLDNRCIEQLRNEEIATPFEKQYIRKDGTRIDVRLFNAVLDPADQLGIGIIIPV
mgnify:CR=1 FL=1